MARAVRVLSIDGGGIRGLIPAVVLAELERRAGRPVADLFDLVAGTSTGGILALTLSLPGADGRPAWRAEEVVELYEREGPAIFDRSAWRRVASAEGLLDEKYPLTGLERAFDRYLGDARLSAAVTDVLVTAYDLEARRPYFFKSARARLEAPRDLPMRTAALATSAAPTYFEPVPVDVPGGGRMALVDGGVYATNPGMCAYVEALKGEGAEEVVMLSLGTGELVRRIRYEDAREWGLIEWARPVIDVVFDGVGDTVDHQLGELLGPNRYFRMQTTLDRANDDMDDAGAKNLAALHEQAEGLVAASSHRLDAALAALGA